MFKDLKAVIEQMQNEAERQGIGVGAPSAGPEFKTRFGPEGQFMTAMLSRDERRWADLISIEKGSDMLRVKGYCAPGNHPAHLGERYEVSICGESIPGDWRLIASDLYEPHDEQTWFEAVFDRQDQPLA